MIMCSVRMLLWMMLLTGMVYPGIITLVAQGLIPQKARGSMIIVKGQTVGSELIGQKFSSPKYFWPRPSASDYHALPARGSNLGPTSAVLKQLVEERREVLEIYGKEVPSELLFASASGIDPHISPESAIFQIGRIAAMRGLETQEIMRLIRSNTIKPFFGRQRINVLQLNLALDQIGP